MKIMPLISIVIPAFNEAQSLENTIAEIRQTLSSHCELEFLVIDDGSTDNTHLVAYQLVETVPNFRYLRFTRNFGKEAALTAGLRNAKGDAVILADADGQHPPKVMLMFIEKWQAGFETVYGTQIERDESNHFVFAKKMYYQLMERFASIDIPANAGDFRLIDRKVVDSLNLLPENNRYMKGLYAWVGYKSIAVPYKARERHVGKSRFNFVKLISLGVAGLTGFSVLPLRLVSFFGLLVSLIAFALGAQIFVYHFFEHEPIPGWPTLAVGMMFFAGIELLALGVIGEYVGNIFEEVKGRPLYLIAENVSKRDADQ